MSSNIYSDCNIPSPRSIRLVRTLKTNPELSCFLWTTDLGNPPAYAALSYTWGNPPPVNEAEDPASDGSGASIVINGHRFPVTASLHAALLAVDAAGCCSSLWIDAVCINQHDPAERAQQVAIMGNIYAAAADVLIWAGAPPEGLDLDHLGTFLADLKAAFGGVPPVEEAQSLSVAKLREHNVRTPTRALRAWNRFLERAWFKRAWTFQEAVLARHAQFLCGSRSFPWDNALQLTSFLQRSHLSILQGETPSRTIDVARSGGMFAANLIRTALDSGYLGIFSDWVVPSFRDRIGTKMVHSPSMGDNVNRAYWLLWFVEEIQGRSCRDLRDKVYSAVGIMNRIIPPWRPEDDFPVSYD